MYLCMYVYMCVGGGDAVDGGRVECGALVCPANEAHSTTQWATRSSSGRPHL